MSLSIEIFNCSAVLFNGTSPIEAHAGQSFSILKWIDAQMAGRGKLHVSGWHRLQVLRDKEKEAVKNAEAEKELSDKT